MTRQHALCRLAVLAVAFTWIGGVAYAIACTPLENPAIPGEYVGCCDQTGTVMADGTACIGQPVPSTGRINTCMAGVCQAGVCSAPFVGIDGPGNHPPCVDPGNTCQIGECYGTGQCKNIDNSATKGKMPVCGEPDDNGCTKDCVEEDPAVNPLGAICHTPATPLYFGAGFPCSISSGGADCERGTCDGSGVCDGTGETTTCTGSLNDCEIFICSSLDPVTNDPMCEKVGKPLGTLCDLEDPNDCHFSFCDDGGGNCRAHHDVNEGFDCVYGKPECHFGICGSGGACNGNFLRATDFPCTDDGNSCTQDKCLNSAGDSVCVHFELEPAGTACAPDNNVCTLDVCDAGGTCTHAADPAAQGQSCNSIYACVDTAVCSGVQCNAVTCETTGKCNGCSSAPSCTNNPATSCGCQ